MLKRRRALIAAIKKGRLPSGYQEVEYLKSSDGVAYIDVNYLVSINSKIEIRQASSGNNQTGVIGGGGSGWCVAGSYGSTIGLASLFCVTTRQGKLYLPYDENVHTYYISNGYQRIDDTEFYDTTISSFNPSDGMPDTAYDNVRKFGLFRCNTRYRYNQSGFMEIYYCKMWDYDELMRDLIPCYRKSDSVAGMYDLVNDVFYTNAGTGSFIIGPDVN